MILVDTSVWYAAYVDEVPEHAVADALLTAPKDRLATTDYIVDELLTLLVARGHRPVAKALGRQLLSESLCEIILDWTFRRHCGLANIRRIRR
jgi:predicted nucleic acid-binding protein